nr:hypothetical protein [Tanacetum cinerariifolium]
MSTPTFAITHNLIAYLEKSTESEGFEQIIDFLNESSVSYALRASPTIRTSCIKQFWTMVKVKTINDEVMIQSLIDEKRHYGISNHLSCYKSEVQFLKLGDMSHHKDIYDNPSLTKKVFANMKLIGTGFSRVVTLLFDNMLVPAAKEVELMDLCTHLSNKVLELESEVIDIKSTYKERIEKLKGRIDRLDEENMVLKDLYSVHSKVDTAAPVVEKEKSFKQGRIITDIDEDDVDDEEPAEVEELLEVVTAAKLITEVVTTAGATTTAEATRVSVSRGRRGVVIQDPEETTSTIVVHSEVQSKDKGKEATLLASKIPIVDYKIHLERNKPYFKIIRADGNHMLFLSFSTLLKNFDREDLESLWKLVKERFEKTEPKNYTDDYLLKTLKTMFEHPDVEASV